jgi:hypothetical protein
VAIDRAALDLADLLMRDSAQLGERPLGHMESIGLGGIAQFLEQPREYSNQG